MLSVFISVLIFLPYLFKNVYCCPKSYVLIAQGGMCRELEMPTLWFIKGSWVPLWQSVLCTIFIVLNVHRMTMRRQDIADGMRIKKKKKDWEDCSQRWQPTHAQWPLSLYPLSLDQRVTREKWNFSFTVPWISMCASVCLKVAFSCRKWLHFSNLPTLKSIIRELWRVEMALK